MDLQTFGFRTSQGPAFFTAPSQQPRVLMIHGFARRAADLAQWSEIIPDLGYLHLPGHGGAPAFSEVSVSAWAQGFCELVERFKEPPLIVGESLGAVIGLSIPSRAVIAIEPPLSTHQLWPLWETIALARNQGLAVDPALEALFLEPFHWVLSRITSPTLLVAGTEPLLPERALPFEPSLLTDEDFDLYANHPLVEAHRITGGHALMDNNPAGILAIAQQFMSTHGFLWRSR